jgi:hypothetical protein
METKKENMEEYEPPKVLSFSRSDLAEAIGPVEGVCLSPGPD